MRRLNQFSAVEWLQLAPLAQLLRQVRNDALLRFYQRVRPPGLDEFLAKNAGQAGKDVALVIAFEQPWTLDWLLAMARKNLRGVTVLVFDNSRTSEARQKIRDVCDRHVAPYLALPPYKTRHVNRSHGMAMSWIYHNVVRAIQPRIFGFLDHDLIPVNEVDLSERLREQPVFGLINTGNFNHWSTWAGYCVFRFEAVRGQQMNFLYDFSRGLDTGGRNWNPLYRQLDRGQLRFASRDFVSVTLPSGESREQVEFIDEGWVHIGGVGYNENFKNNFDFFNGLKNALEAGASWDRLCSNRQPEKERA
jgi:hypothetical protein